MREIMSARDIVDAIKEIPQYITYIYPGYITLYVYAFLRAEHMRDTKGMILKSVALSYIYSVCLEKIYGSSELWKNFLLIITAVLVAYTAYIIVKSETICDIFDRLGIQTTFWNNEIEALQGFDTGAWLTVYLKNEDIVYEGHLHLKELEPGQRHYISLTAYWKYKLGEDGTPIKPYIESNDNNPKEEVVIFYENINRIEKREILQKEDDTA